MPISITDNIDIFSDVSERKNEETSNEENSDEEKYLLKKIKLIFEAYKKYFYIFFFYI